MDKFALVKSLIRGCTILAALSCFLFALSNEVLAAPASSFSFPLGAGYARRGLRLSQQDRFLCPRACGVL